MHKNSFDLPKIILVLGMHRSGTSLVAQIIAKWGAFMGDDLMRADKYNPDGYWEYNPLFRFHEKLLNKTNNQWFAPSEDINVKELVIEFGDEARELVQQMDNGGRVWCWKDPRLSLFIGFWKEILFDRDIIFLLPIRNPIDIASSLFDRDNLPPSITIALWEFSTYKIFEALSSQKNYMFIDYDKIVFNPENTIKELYIFLNELCKISENKDAYLNMISSVKRTLNHAKPNPSIKLNPLQLNLQNQIRQGEIPMDFEMPENQIWSLKELFRQYCELHQLNLLLQQQNRLSDLQRNQLTDLQEYVKISEERIQEQTQEIVKLEEEENNKTIEISNLRYIEGNQLKQLDDYEKEIQNFKKNEAIQLFRLEKLENEINQLKESNHKNENENKNKQLIIYSLEEELIRTRNQLANREMAITQITSSFSWKYTKPFRTISESYPAYKSFVHKILKTLDVGDHKYIEQSFSNNSATSTNETLILEESLQRKLQKLHSRIPSHTTTVDIIVCVHNAPEDVKKCLSSILRYTNPPYQIILVDDGSKIETQKYLEEFSVSQGCKLIRNEQATGYTKAANQGLKASTATLVLLLNSDTIIGNEEWLDRMILCAFSETEIGIVSTLSNTASWQSIPKIFIGDDWADNALPDDFSIPQMAKMVSDDSGRIYPKIPFLNGFCLLIKRDCLNDVGYFDEVSFPEGYGEENDFCIRSIKRGWKLAVADDVYIYHAQSKSYSNERRQKIARLSDIALTQKHSADHVMKGVLLCKENLVLHGIRSRAAQFADLNLIQNKCRNKYGNKKVLFVLPVTALGGGANVVIQEIRALRSMQIDCYIANKSEFKLYFESAYEIDDIPVLYFDSTHSLAIQLDYFDAVIGTAWTSIDWIREAIQLTNCNIITGYYIQDYEPYFYPEGSKLRKESFESYSLIPGMKLFTKTQWNKNEVLKNTGLEPTVIQPSLNTELFRPFSDKSFTERIHITAMVRPETPRRSPELTLQTLKEIKELFPEHVEIRTFGCLDGDKLIQNFKSEFDFKHYGILNPEQLSILFNESHIFIDMSAFQAMGLTGMEAMACGNVVVLPKQGGSDSFIRNDLNGFLIDTSNSKACVSLVDKLLNNRITLSLIANQAISDIFTYSPYFSAKNILTCLFDSES